MKIIDFGLATYLHNNENYTKCGTPGFLAPEMFGTKEEVKAKTSPMLDVFSLGAMFYFMLTNKFPFDSEKSRNIYANNKKMDIDFSVERLKKVDSDCLDLLKSMLEPDMEKRISCVEALSHSFFHFGGKYQLNSGNEGGVGKTKQFVDNSTQLPPSQEQNQSDRAH